VRRGRSVSDIVVSQLRDEPVTGHTNDTRGTGIAWLFGVTALIGAGLLFIVQPMVAKLVLPSYGGSATVWSTSSLFFQVLLLGGYVYTHLATTRLSHKVQPRVHLLVLAIPLVTLPVALPASAAPGADSSPALWLLRTLALMIGLPFLVVSTTGPLLQRWYSWTDSRRSDDPYFLFAASNLGSFGGLLAYPFLIEPNLTLDHQRYLWSGGFVLFAALMAVCGIVAGLRRGDAVREVVRTRAVVEPVGRRRIAYWLCLAFLPSTLMLAVTAHLSTDVAPIPLLWVVPLAIYLATFVLAFARSERTAPIRVTRVAVAMTVVAVVLVPGGTGLPIALVVGVNLVMLGLVGFSAHARLAADRPDPAHLTLFYLVIAVGGALGGALNGLLAPVIFDRVLEYPLALICAPLLLVGLQASPSNWFSRRYHSAFVGVVVAIVLFSLYLVAIAGLGSAGLPGIVVVPVLLLVLAWGFGRHPKALAASLALVFVASAAWHAAETINRTRTFYGSYSVVERDDKHLLVHGNTVHGVQMLDPDRRMEPTGYYESKGPLGDVFRSGDFERVGVIGLGAGGIAAWGSPGQTMKFFEIDPEIVKIARDASLFTYLADSAADIELAEGDGRLLMEREDRASFDLIILDAFNSDSIPIHLLTRDAMRIYADRLKSDGLLVIHISNRIFDLEPVLAAAADDLGWEARIGRSSRSWWVALSPAADRISSLPTNATWQPIATEDPVRWTDDYSSVLDVLR